MMYYDIFPTVMLEVNFKLLRNFIFQWVYCGQTVIYSYERMENKEHCVVFFQTKLEEAYLQYVKPIVALAASDEHCILILRVENQVGQVCYVSSLSLISLILHSL